MASCAELQEVAPQEPGEPVPGRCHAAARPALQALGSSLCGGLSFTQDSPPGAAWEGEALSEIARLVIRKHSSQVPFVRRYSDMSSLPSLRTVVYKPGARGHSKERVFRAMSCPPRPGSGGSDAVDPERNCALWPLRRAVGSARSPQRAGRTAFLRGALLPGSLKPLQVRLLHRLARQLVFTHLSPC